MRYAVKDDYARAAAVEFYRALLAHPQPKSVAAALTLARQALLDGDKHDLARFVVCDHATPVLYGEEQPGLQLAAGRSPGLNPRDPRLHPIAELTTAGHEHFVGRTWELAGLGSDFIGTKRDAVVKPVAVVTGLGGMGKTALTAEALALWERRFAWVLLYQAKPSALSFDATLRDIHIKLMGEGLVYHDHVRAYPADAVYRAVSAEFTGEDRQQRLTRNLVRALRDEAILLVLDNFEGNLKLQAEPMSAAGEPVWTCRDPAWDRCLRALATDLVGSPSRVLITCRRPLAALSGGLAYPVLLGPLSASEAALYLGEHPALSKMVFGADAGEKALALRLLNASRFHPLLMDRLARLAADFALRPQLLAALDALETTKDFAALPELFATPSGDAVERTYLEDALASSLDQLIRDCSPDARRLLWIIALANQPEALGLVRGVWSGESQEHEQLRHLKQMLDMLPMLPAELQGKLRGMPAELRAQIDAVPPEGPSRPDLASLLRHLVRVGLVTEERTDPEDKNPDLTCHELVRERIRVWMAQHPADRAELAEAAIRLGYAERLEVAFHALRHQNMAVALQAGSRALVYCVEAGAWERLGGFASGLVTSTQDPRLLEGLLPHLQNAADSAPEGDQRWSCLCYLADALRNGGRSADSLPFFEQAASQARAVAEAGGDGSPHAWSDLGWITGNWANALGDAGCLDAARQRQLESAEAKRQAGSSKVAVIGSELEALRIDIALGNVATALPEVDARLAQIGAWWRRHGSGEAVPEAPHAESLARAFISCLDIAGMAHSAQEDWEAAVCRVEGIIDVKRALARPAEDIATDRFNRATMLIRLRSFGEAKAELEECLHVFRDRPDMSANVLGALANLFVEQGDVDQAIVLGRRALATRDQLPDPAARAVSHNNLASYLDRSGGSSGLAESVRHQLAALIYRLVAGLGQSLKTAQYNYAVGFRRARAAGTILTVPRVTELLAIPAFSALEAWLRQRQVDPVELQTAVDRFLDQAGQLAEQDPADS